MATNWRSALSLCCRQTGGIDGMTLRRLANARLADGGLVDVDLAAGRIAAITPATAGPQTDTLDLKGRLLVPGLVEGHIHLDKVLLGLPFQPHRPGGTVAERNAAEKTLLRARTVPEETRAKALIAQISRFGTTSLRSHVDIDTDHGLANLHALLRVRE